MLILPNWLIVYGTNRNAGKTTLITEIISHFCDDFPMMGIKISPHFHELGRNACVLAKTDHYVVVRETETKSGKDSSRMLEAGAKEVLYIQVWDENLGQLIPHIIERIKPGSAVICESGWARKLIDPGLFLIVNKKGNTEIKQSVSELKRSADRWIEFDGTGFDFNPDELDFRKGTWMLK